MKHNSALFFVCSLVEFIGRQQKLKRSQVVDALGETALRRIYKYADTLHCEPIAKTADEFITLYSIPTGDFDNVARCKYEVPDYWTIGEVYERLIADVTDGDVVETLMTVYHSWMDGAISDYNSDLFYQSREYLAECYRAGTVL